MRTRSNGCPASAARSSSTRASSPEAATPTSKVIDLRASEKISREVSLSSTTRTRRPRKSPTRLAEPGPRLSGQAEGRREGEDTPLAGLTLDPDLASHHLDEP